MSTGNLSGYSMHDLFRMEAEGQTQVLTDGLLALERAPTSAAELEACMRAAHSLKGAARIVGLLAAVVVAHAMEDCLVEAQQGRITLSKDVIDVLLRGVDLLGRIAGTPVEDAERWTQEASPEADEFRAALASVLGASSDVQASAATVDSSAGHATRAGAKETDERVLRVTARNLNRMLGLAGESLVESRWLEPFIRSLTRLKHLQRDTAIALDRLNDAWSGHSADSVAAGILAEARAKIVECQRVLADRVNQLEMFDRRYVSVAHRLYDGALASHMRPFADGTHEFRRMVRDLARGLGKEAHLEIAGETTQVDRDVLESLKSPLTHLLRNAVDHGIESPMERMAAGKPAEGRVRLTDQALQRLRVWPVGEAHPLLGLIEGQAPAVDVLAADPAGDGAEPRAGARRAGVDMIGQAVEQAGVQLEHLAVGIDVGAGEARPKERCAQFGGGAEQPVDVAVLEAAQLVERQPQLLQHARRVDLAAVGR